MTSSSSTVTAESLLTASAGSSAGKGSYEIVINDLAKGDRLESSATFSSLTDTTLASGSLTITTASGTGTLDLDGKNLTQIRDSINALNDGSNSGGATGVTASILQLTGGESPTYRLLLSNDATGLTEGNIGISGSSSMAFTEKQASADAALTVNGTSITRSTNSINDVIPGMTLTLNKKDPATTVTLNVDRDTKAIEEQVNKFINAYNDVMSFIGKQSTYNESTKTTGGALFGDATMKGVKHKLQDSVLSARSPLGAALSKMGVTIGSDNSLSLDSTKFQEALKTNFSDTTSLFNSLGASLSSTLDRYTDSIDGSVTRQQKSVQDSISHLEKKITTTEEKIERTMEMLTKRFIAMDSAVGQMQSQASQLTSLLGSS